MLNHNSRDRVEKMEAGLKINQLRRDIEHQTALNQAKTQQASDEKIQLHEPLSDKVRDLIATAIDRKESDK